MKLLHLVALLLALFMVGSLSAVGAQDNGSNTCVNGLLNSSCNSDLARLCATYLTHWEAAGGENSNLTIPDWCDPANQPTQPNDDNACNGGLLDGRCKTDWTWTCGWYLQQWEAAGGWYGSYTVPDWCDPASLLPRKPEVPVTTLAGCYTNGTYSFYYSGVSGSTVVWFSSGVTNCAGTSINYSQYAIEAPDKNTASNTCLSLTANPTTWYPSAFGYNSPANIWFCSVI